MTTISHSPLSRSRLAMAVAIAQMVSPSSLYAMEDEKPKADPHHDRALTGLVNRNLFTHHHFVTPEGQTAPKYSIKTATASRSARIHEEQMKRYEAAKTPTVLPTPSITVPSPSPVKEDQQGKSSLLGSIVYAPVHLVSGLYTGLYNSLPSWGSSPKQAPDTSVLPQIGQSPQSDNSSLSAVEKNTRAQSDLRASALLTGPSASIATVDQGPQDSSTKGGPTRPRQRIIVSGSGGGVRGILVAEAYKYLEGKDGANMPISDFVDVAAGSSISGILALGLVTNGPDGKPIMSGSRSVDLFTLRSDDLFPTTSSRNIPARIWGTVESLWYPQRSAAKIESLLQQEFGTETTLGSARTNVLITALDSTTNTPLLINNIDHPVCKTWEAARGTSAAPTIYEAFQMLSLPGQPIVVDGGLWENAPPFEALLWDQSQARRLSSAPYNPIVLSLGTGRPPVNSIPNQAGILNVGSILEACIEAQVNATDLTLKKLLREGETYFNFNPKLQFAVGIDDPSADNYRMMSAAFQTQLDVLDQFLDTDEVRLRIEAKDTK